MSEGLLEETSMFLKWAFTVKELQIISYAAGAEQEDKAKWIWMKVHHIAGWHRPVFVLFLFLSTTPWAAAFNCSMMTQPCGWVTCCDRSVSHSVFLTAHSCSSALNVYAKVCRNNLRILSLIIFPSDGAVSSGQWSWHQPAKRLWSHSSLFRLQVLSLWLLIPMSEYNIPPKCL